MKNKEVTVDLLNDITKLNIADFEFEDLKNMKDSSGYDFSIIKFKANLAPQKQEKEKVSNEYLKSNNNRAIEEVNQVNLYIKMIKKDRIKESIFCYWSLLYDEKFKDFEESEFTSIINKVRITETENEENKHSVLLEIKENKWGILEYGSTIHLIKFKKYLNDKTIKKSKLMNKWNEYIEEDNQDVLFIGVVN